MLSLLRHRLTELGLPKPRTMVPAPLVVIDERDPRAFLSAAAAALLQGSSVLLADPDWTPERRQRARDLGRNFSAHTGAEPEVLIATGGTSGTLRLVRHTPSSLAAAAEGYHARFAKLPVTFRCVLPVWHVGGFMQFVRAVCAPEQSTPRLIFDDYKNWLTDAPADSAHDEVLSLVPTQLHRLLEHDDATRFLQRFRAIFIGGAALSTRLRECARAAQLRIAPSYGMTETAAMVTAMDPDTFLAGGTGCGTPLPHARIHVRETDNRICVASDSNALGYLPAEDDYSAGLVVTSDRGHFDANGSLHVLGRADRVVISGGKKINAQRIEEAILACRENIDTFVFGMPDPEWGERLCVLLAPASENTDPESLRHELRTRLASWEMPKSWRQAPEIPRTEMGKPDMDAIRALFR